MRVWGSLLLILIGASAFMVVRTRDPVSQVLALTYYGILLALMFFLFRAPDVALAQIVIGAVALPLLIMLAIARMKKHASLAAKEAHTKQHEAESGRR